MTIERYDHYSKPRLYVTDRGVYMVRDVLDDEGHYSGVTEYARYIGGDVQWTVCREAPEFDQIAPFLPAECVDVVSVPPTEED